MKGTKMLDIQLKLKLKVTWRDLVAMIRHLIRAFQ